MLHLLDISEYNARAFQPIGGRMPLFGKSDPPPPPDYASAARETAAGNLAAARSATKANRINQYTPYGKLTYSQKPTGAINYQAYNSAMASHNAALARQSAQPQSNYQFDPNNPLDIERPGFGGPNFGDKYGSSQMPLTAPKPEDFMEYDPDSGWEQNMELNPEAQAALDQQLALNRKYGEVANLGFDKVRAAFENPEMDVSQLPKRAIDVGQTAQQAILSRLNPQMQQREEQLRAQMANQGIGLGSTAFGREMANYNQGRNDLEMQAALQGIGLDQANRASALQEQAYLKDRPLNLINALRTGNQVQNPQFQQFAQQATTGGPNMLGAANAQYGAQMNAYNADQAQQGGLMKGLFGLATAPLGGTAIGGMFGM